MRNEQLFAVVKKFLRYSFNPSQFTYDQLTQKEKALCTREEYDALLDWMRQPNDEDRKNFNFKLETSPFFTEPHKFLKMGDRVRAKFRIWDLPNNEPDWGWVSAEAGEEGVVEHVEEGFWPTVRFEKTGRSTCVTDFEVEKLT